MKSAQLESLLDSIEQLQQIMKEIAVGEADLEDEEDSYAQLYRDIDLQLDLLRGQGVSISNPNPFRSLREWRKHSYSMGKYVDRRVDVYDRYHHTLSAIERFLAHQYISLETFPEPLADGLHPQSLKNFLKNIHEIQSIMKQVARGTSIEDKEESYSKKYRELALQFAILQELELAISNPNRFRSLWQFYSFWGSQLESGYAAREKAVDDLYEEISSDIDRALYKHRKLLTPVTDFVRDLQQDLKESQADKALEVILKNMSESTCTSIVSVGDSELKGSSEANLTGVAQNSDTIYNTDSSEVIVDNNNQQITSRSSRRKISIQQELKGFEKEYRLLYEQWTRLQQAWAIETDVLTKFKLEVQKDEKKRELDQVSQQIEAIESELQVD